MFNQNKYNEKILKWLVEHGYDVGNHTMNHVDFTKVGVEETIKEVSGVYNILDGIIPNQYVNIIALPFGSPYRRNHSNYGAILGNVENVLYKTKAALRVGWEAEVSCFDVSFAPTFLKRIRAYDNNGKDFDIKMNFDLLENKRYVSDGDVNTIVALEKDQSRIVSGNRKVILY